MLTVNLVTGRTKRRVAERAQRRAWYLAHKDEVIAKVAAWRAAHPEQSKSTRDAWYAATGRKAEDVARMREWRAKNPEKVLAQRERQRPKGHGRHVRRTFGLAPEAYQAMLSAQDGVCAICRRPETRTGRGGRITPLAVDHCHATGAVRGLLCADCNTSLGRFEDDADRIRRAADYIEKFR